MPTDIDPTKQSRDFRRVEKAMRYLRANFREQPKLEDIAGAACLSPAHFQRLFSRWAGVSPSQFLRFLTMEEAKRRLEDSESVLGAALDAGLSGPGRLHDLFVTFEGVTPGEYKAKGSGVTIGYGFHQGPFGEFLIASTERGVCALEFIGEDGREVALEAIRARWPGARLEHAEERTGPLGHLAFLRDRAGVDATLKIWCKGTNFQIQVWRALLSIPPGNLVTYGAIARAIGAPRSARAVGNALAANPIAYLIPCHRVIRETALAGTNYCWGASRKLAMIGWEAAQGEAGERARVAIPENSSRAAPVSTDLSI